MRNRFRSAWWRSEAGGCSCEAVLSPATFGCDALVGLLPLLAILAALLDRSLGSPVLGMADAAWSWACWNGLLSSSVGPFSWGGVIAIEETPCSMDLTARAPSSSSAFLLRELVTLLVLALVFLLLLDMAGGGCGAGPGWKFYVASMLYE